MLKRAAGLLAAVLLIGLLAQVPAQAAGVSVRIQGFYPVPDATSSTGYRWVQMRCDGTDVLNGVGNVRFIGYATNTDVSKRDAQRFAMNFGQNSLTSGQLWYPFIWTRLTPGVETKVVDGVIDLNSGSTQNNMRFGVPGQPNALCGFTVNNPPRPTEGLISPRTTPTLLARSLRIEVFKYVDGTPLRCGTSDFSSRVRVKFFADGDPGLYDFHMHVEDSGIFGSGPNQSGDGRGGRAWEMGYNGTVLPTGGGVGQQPGQVGELIQSFSGKHAEIHFAQQTPAGTPKNEVFCSLGS